MTDTQVIDQDVKQDPVVTDVNPVDSVPYSRFKEVNDKQKSLQDQLNAMTKSQKDADDAKLAEQGEYKELLDKAKLDLESATTKATEWDAYQELRRNTLIEKIPEDDRELCEGMTLGILEKFANKFNNKVPDVANGGADRALGYNNAQDVLNAVRSGDITNAKGQGILAKLRSQISR